MTTLNLPAIRQDFPIVESCIYVNHAAVGPMSRTVQTAILERTEIDMLQTARAWDLGMVRSREGRALAAKLVNCKAVNVAYVQNTSYGISLIANGIDWRSGDNVVVPDREFPSNYLAWQNLNKRGVELRRIVSDQGRITPENVQKVVDSRTRVVTLSHVQYYNGFMADLAAVAEICRHHDVLLVVDGTQSIGAMTIDLAATGVDALVVSAHKWMLGPLGIGFIAFSDRAMSRVDVNVLGWLSVEDPFDFEKEMMLLPDASRFEPGTENAEGIFGLVARLRTLDSLGPKLIENRVISLTDRLCDGLKSRGYTLTSPRQEGSKSGIVTFEHPIVASEQLLEKLTAANIQVSLRFGAIRVSPHYYNSEEEIDFILETLSQNS